MIERNVSWPGWEVTGVIGRGSYGAVYRIQRQIFDEVEQAALKVISIPQSPADVEELISEGYDKATITQRFEGYLKDIIHEYALMAKLKGHTNVVYCDDVRYVQHEGDLGWDIYIKMELLTPITRAFQDAADDGAIVRLGIDICNALELCKKRNIVHRDIKPQNIFVSEDGDFKLGDFGVAKVSEKTTGGTRIGTYKYMAPEVYHSKPYGAAADIYSLGLVLYWLLNERRHPFLPLPPEVPSSGMEEQARQRRLMGEALPAPKHGSEALKAVVLKACSYDPADRYADAAEMRKALERVAGIWTPFPPAPVQFTEKEPVEINPLEDPDKTIPPWEYAPAAPEEATSTVGGFNAVPSVKQPTPAARKSVELIVTKPQTPPEPQVPERLQKESFWISKEPIVTRPQTPPEPQVPERLQKESFWISKEPIVTKPQTPPEPQVPERLQKESFWISKEPIVNSYGAAVTQQQGQQEKVAEEERTVGKFDSQPVPADAEPEEELDYTVGAYSGFNGTKTPQEAPAKEPATTAESKPDAALQKKHPIKKKWWLLAAAVVLAVVLFVAPKPQADYANFTDVYVSSGQASITESDAGELVVEVDAPITDVRVWDRSRNTSATPKFEISQYGRFVKLTPLSTAPAGEYSLNIYMDGQFRATVRFEYK